MSKIHVMSELLANKIAAGEVVERISSVVKELVENSIDASSKVIIVDLVESGTREIKVTDDGCGMNHDDALLAFQRHATSKISKEEDLFFINTLGFRGEALASIASVSKVDLRTSEGDAGTHVYIEGGNLVTDETSDARRGSTILIKDLFFNTPARLKYLKSDQTELASVTSFIEKLALSRPDISFTLTNNDKQIVYTSGSNILLKAIHEIYGYTVSSNMIEVRVSNDDYDVYGYICKPVVLKSNKYHMTTIVNGRVVTNNDVNRAINDGYFTFKPDIKYPVVVLTIETDPTLIDVNVHPSKRDIKFSKMDSLYSLLRDSINDSLKKTLLIQNMEVGVNVPIPHTFEPTNNLVDDKSNEAQLVMNYASSDLETEKTHKFDEVQEEVNESSLDKQKNEDIKRLELYPIGIALTTFIVAENQDGIYLIDQHAAHERVNYEKVVREFKEHKIYSTSMLIPMTIELSPSDFIKIKENLDKLAQFGFVIEEFGINTFVVKEHPTWLREGYEEETIRKIFDLVINETNFDPVKFNNRVLATIACKMSVRANEHITMEEAKSILDQLVLCEQPYNCPHGRPTIIHYTTYELERMFKRVMN